MSIQSGNEGELDQRLADILEHFLQRRGADGETSVEQLLASHPELAPDLESCLRAIDFLGGGGGSVTRGAEPALAAGADVLGDYRILREVGRGGMGIVFEAEQRSLGRRVALKVLPWAALLDSQQRARFHNEARLAAQLHHTHIVPVFSVGSESGVDFYAMQFIDGEPLDLWVKRFRAQRTQPDEIVETIISLGAQAADGLAYAHRMGVIHRDIKPSNLLVDRSTNLWITDFGVARSQSRGTLTATGDRVGTLRYMSPEQFSSEAIDHRTDIFALGVTLWELLTPPPSHGEQPLAVEAAPAAQRGWFTARGMIPGLPRDLETVLRKAVAPDRADRYQSANDLADDLRRYLRGEPVAAQRPSLLTVGAKWVLRHRRLAAACLLATLLAVAGLAASTFLVAAQRVEAERQRDRAEATRRANQLAEGERRQADSANAERHRAERLLALQQTHDAALRLEQGDSHGLLELVRARKTAANEPVLARDIESLWSRWHAALADRLVHVVGHTQPVVAAAFSPDGKLLATASDDASVALWDTQTGRKHGQTMRHDRPITVICFDERGDLLASGDEGGTIRLWAVATGGESRQPLAHPGGAVRTLAFRPGASTLMSAAEGSHVVRLWSLEATVPMVDLKHDAPVTQAIFVGGGAIVATTARDQLCLWDTATGQLRQTPIRNDHSLFFLRASPDGSLVAAGGPDSITRVWQVSDGQPAGPPLAHEAMLVDLRFSPDGRWLATATSDRVVRRFDTSTWQQHGESLRQPKRITSLAFSTDSRMLAAGSRDGGVRVWDAESGEEVSPPLWHQAAVRTVAFDRSTPRLVTASDDGTARIWNLDSVARGNNLQHEGGVAALATSPDSRLLMCGTTLGELVCWDLNTRSVRWRADGHQGRIMSVAISPDGALAASAGRDGIVRLWQTATGQRHAESLHYFEQVHEVAFLPTGEALVVGCNDKTVSLWDLTTFKRRQLRRDAEAVWTLAADPEGKLLAFGGTGWYTNVVSLAAPGDLIAVLPHGDRVRSMCFAPTFAGFLAVGGIDGEVRLWNVPSLTPRGKPLEQGGEVYDLDVHPDGVLLAAAVRDRGFIQLWDVVTILACDGVPLGRQSRALSTSFTPDGQLLVSGWADGVCWLWPVPKLPTDLAAMQRASEVALGARLYDTERAVALPWVEWQQLRATDVSDSSVSPAR